METKVWEKETLLTNKYGGYPLAIEKKRPSHEKRRKLLLGTLVLSTNLFSFLVGCSLNWAAFSSAAFSRTKLDKDWKHSLFADIDRNNLHETTFEPFSYEMSNYTTPAGGGVDVDALWGALGADYESFLIPAADAVKFDLRPEHVLYTPEMVSNPPGIIAEAGYPATIQAIHQIHCLNLIRKALWFNADYYRQEAKGSWGGNQSEAVIQAHVGHCIDTLRQVIMCNADTDVVPFFWLSRHGRTISDFARHKQCHSFESVRSWAEKHQFMALEHATFEPPADVTLAKIVGI